MFSQLIMVLPMLASVWGISVNMDDAVEKRQPPENQCSKINARWVPVHGGEISGDICIISEANEDHSATFAGPVGGGGNNNVVVSTRAETIHDLDGSTLIQWAANMQNNMGHAAEFYASTSNTERGAPIVIEPGARAAHLGYQNDYIEQLYLSIKWLS
ncbi:hypothetical protein PTMSG1_08403 [Pyrenophora teres f. maculata]|nr:hypothetical protein PTMSG1_08403 [Pyrenophora teres f. maculata]